MILSHIFETYKYCLGDYRDWENYEELNIFLYMVDMMDILAEPFIFELRQSGSWSKGCTMHCDQHIGITRGEEQQKNMIWQDTSQFLEFIFLKNINIEKHNIRLYTTKWYWFHNAQHIQISTITLYHKSVCSMSIMLLCSPSCPYHMPHSSNHRHYC